MKVLHIYRTYFPDPPGGLQEAIRQISLSTRACGVEPGIFTLSPNPVPRQVRFPEGIVTRSRSWAAPASCDLGGLESLRQYRAQAESVDILHFHFPWPFADVLHLLGRVKKPTVMTYHSDVVRQRALGYVYGPLMRSTLRSMSAVVATSAVYAQSSPVLTSVVDEGRLKAIPLGIIDYRDDPVLGRFSPRCLHRLQLGDEPYVLALGVLRYYKGLHTLIEAAPSIASKIVIAGSGPEMERLTALACEVGANNVVFAGQVSHEEKVALLSGCRALVMPSHLRSEAFGMVLVEAEMFGKPMVCCEMGSGTSYVNEHGVTGLVVPPEAPVRFAAAVNELVNDEVLARKMGAAARERYERLFSGPALGNAYRGLYEEVLG
ncbi:glycosyltransferase [Paraburkholderia rhynchosiae]|uniref:D-inositol-3-phosphate glycosyltransferase n=1 Tax=Paraburkholderia rhynchosiae TaxID=487049 RepID=A0A2N7WXV2_9BURK|nr:glycosyltransferase [Paraburkholderia rhynchosiae]PMS34210.1 glycosyl transferase [Paraburkholderia rhynchosiae]CAB3637635.1 D-inositol-3-phosphate glycosyltransferase [Paraburkholderia rhynchosiae]